MLAAGLEGAQAGPTADLTALVEVNTRGYSISPDWQAGRTGGLSAPRAEILKALPVDMLKKRCAAAAHPPASLPLAHPALCLPALPPADSSA